MHSRALLFRWFSGFLPISGPLKTFQSYLKNQPSRGSIHFWGDFAPPGSRRTRYSQVTNCATAEETGDPSAVNHPVHILSGHLIRQSPRKISPSNRRDPFLTVIPAKAGIQKHWTGLHSDALDSRLRGNDGEEVASYDPLVHSSYRLRVERISCSNYDSPH